MKPKNSTLRLSMLSGLILAALSASATAATLTVTTTGDSMDAFDQQCSLREAVHNANTNTQFSPVVNECAPGSSDNTDVIELASGETYLLTIAGAGDDAGDLDLLDGSTLGEAGYDLQFVVTGNSGSAGIQQSVVGQRVIEIAEGAGVTLDHIVVQGGNLDGAGGGISNDGDVVLTDSLLFNNSASSGGGLYNDGTATLIDTQVVLNTATFVGGGGIFNAAGSVSLENTTVRGNQGTDGGGIYNDAGANLYVESGSQINLNTASGNGGGVHHLGSGTLFVSGSTMQSNTAVGAGGAINHESSIDFFVVNTDFTGNEAADGGAIRALNVGDVIVSGGRFEDNTASGDGGAISAVFPQLVGVEMRGNTAGNRGGALFVTTTGSLSQCTLAQNDALDGGAVHAQIITIEDSDITLNQATGNGGGVLATNKAVIHGSRITQNVSTNGGGLYLGNGPLTTSEIDRSLFASNQVIADGGGIYVDTVLQVTNTTISNNLANDDGAGLYIDESGNVTARFVTIAGNSVSEDIAKYGDLTLGSSVVGTPMKEDCVVALDNPAIISLGANRIEDNSCIGVDELTDLFSVDLMLGPLTDNGGGTLTRVLMPGSPAIDSATLTCSGEPVNGIDQRGALRPAGQACDSGAFELDGELDEALFSDGFED